NNVFIYYFAVYSYVHHRILHSFPTRRSSDLEKMIAIVASAAQTTLVHLSTVDLVIIAFYFALVLGIGFYLKRFAKTGEDFFLAGDRKSTRLNSSHLGISYAVFCLKKKM